MAKLTRTLIKKPTVNTIKAPSSGGLSSNLANSIQAGIGSIIKSGNENKPFKITNPVVEPEQKKEEEPVYSAPTYDTSAYDRMIAAYEAKMRADAEAAKKAKAAEYDAQAKAAYIARLQNERTLSDNLARAGIRGGATETTGARLLSNYENNRNQIEANKSTALTGIDKDASDKIFQYTQTQEAAKLAYLQAREAEDRQIAETKRQEQWTASQNAIERAYNSSEAEKGRQFTTSEREAQQKWEAQQTAKANQLQAQKEKLAQEKAAHDQRAQQIRADYIATVERFRTVDQCNAELKRLASLKKKGKLTDSQYQWRAQYVQLQRSAIQTKKEEEKKAKK